jgi:hypothetical protein
VIGGPFFDILSDHIGELNLSVTDPVSFLAQLELSDPQDLLIAFHYLRHWPAIKPMPELEICIEQMAIIQHYAPMIFGQPDDMHTRATVEHFMVELGGTKASKTPGYETLLAPREWLAVWREAFSRNLIGPIAFGAAFRFFVTSTRGNGVPSQLKGSAAAGRVIATDAMRAAPEGMMRPSEIDAWRALPPIVEVYRGGCANDGDTLLDHAQNPHWSLTKEPAVRFMKGRNSQRCYRALASSMLSTNPESMLPSANGNLLNELGMPYLIQARIPRELVVAYFEGEVAGLHTAELIVDFDRISSDMLEDVTPRAYRWAA